MANIKTILASVVLAAAVAVSVVAFVHPAPANSPQYGALAGPDIASPYLKWGGVATYNASQFMKTATTTLCSMQNPYAATSSLLSFSMQINTPTSTAAVIDVATSTSAFATTTAGNLLSAQSVGSNARATFTFDPVSNNNIVGPGQYVLAKTEGPGVGGYTYGGTCQGTWQAVYAY